MPSSHFTEPDPFAEFAGPIFDAAQAPVLEAPPEPPVREPEPVPPAPADLVWGDDLDDHCDAVQAEYDALRRAEAQVIGEPVIRTTTPGVVPATSEGDPLPFVYVWVDPETRRVVYCKDLTSPPVPRRLGVETLRGLIDDGFRLVVPDQHTARRLVRAAASTARGDTPEAADGARVERQLAVASRLTYSVTLVVLTTSLQRRFWLPAGLDQDNLVHWSRAFDARLSLAGRPMEMMQQLLSVAAQGVEHHAATSAMFYGEMSAVAAARHPGQRARVAAFQGMNRAENGAKVWDTSDTGLIGRNMVTGDVCGVDVIDVDPRGFTATLSQPFKLRTGHRHVFLAPPVDAPGNCAATLVGVRATTRGDLVGRFEAVTSRSAGRNMPGAVVIARAAKDIDHTLHVTEEPYLPFPGRSREGEEPGRWTRTRTVERAAGRWSMPPDVAAAAAPGGQPAP